MYIEPPIDGILDLDFVAASPRGIALQVISKISVAITFAVPNWIKGVRVHSSQNEMEARLKGEMTIALDNKSTADWPLPFPFPWLLKEKTS